MNHKRIFAVLLVLFFSGKALAHGCSDAGFCTMGAMKPDQAYSKKINIKLRSIEWSYYKGATKTTTNVFVANLDISMGITPKTGFQVKLPYQ